MTEIRIGKFSFATKAAATEKIREILYGYSPGTRLDGDDAELIGLLVTLHPRSAEKIGAGIDYITTRRLVGKQPGFWLCRVDGTSDDFSFKKSLSGSDFSHKTQVQRGMRWTVDDQIKNFRRIAFTNPAQPVCPVTGIALSNDPTTHVDHVSPTFAELAATYADAVGGFDAIQVRLSNSHPGVDLMEPHDKDFSKYHRAKATLRLLHRSANLARLG